MSIFISGTSLNNCCIASNGLFPTFCERLLRYFLEVYVFSAVSVPHVVLGFWIYPADVSAALIS